jgi:phage baseplate assembly protein W
MAEIQTNERSFSVTNKTLLNSSRNDVLIIMEKITRLFKTRVGSHFEDKDFGGGLHQFITRSITKEMLNEVDVQCYSAMAQYLPEYSALTEFFIMGDIKLSRFLIRIVYNNEFYIDFSSEFLKPNKSLY